MIVNINKLDREFNSIEEYWLKFKDPYKLSKLSTNYHLISTLIHYQDGFRDYNEPEFNDKTQRLGTLIYDELNDVVTREVIDLTAEEIQARKMSGAMVITQLQGLLMLDQMGIIDNVKTMLEQNEHSASRIYFEYSPTWERDSPIIARMANLLGMNDEQLDNFFLEASQLQ